MRDFQTSTDFTGSNIQLMQEDNIGADFGGKGPPIGICPAMLVDRSVRIHYLGEKGKHKVKNKNTSNASLSTDKDYKNAHKTFRGVWIGVWQELSLLYWKGNRRKMQEYV